ncbi:MAG TPA: hypothetical protein PL131_12125 [Methylotenera sp.]|nr:hypothetical protein [Methylotenera sp.]HPH06610.1 hypothetical protein [Methylotenera sp.]HPN01854.1 hypothetical protein [Methylotenera sp.]
MNMITKVCFIVLSYAYTTNLQAAPNDNFGRLFSRPAERSNLDILRQNQKLKVIVPQPNSELEVIEKATPIELPDPVTLQGYVKRSDGKGNTLWINNQAVQENSTVDSVKIGKLNQRGIAKKNAAVEGVDVSIPANGKQVRLKAGQTFDPESNQIYERQVVEKARNLALEQSGVIDGGDE